MTPDPTGAAGANPTRENPVGASNPYDDDCPPMICPATGMYCTGEFCDDYGCAKKAAFYDDEDGVG